MGLELEYQYGQTPLDEDEKKGLLIKTITSHSELDEHEQLNIENAIEWTLHKKFSQKTILTEGFIKLLHRKMFGDVWKWAGEFRKSEKNIGVEWYKIPLELKQLIDDTEFWIKNKTYPPDEIAIRFKHRLVKIHCFANGNGRHSRIMADIIIDSIFDRPIFSWNYTNLSNKSDVRNNYINALIAADNGDIYPLLNFARS